MDGRANCQKIGAPRLKYSIVLGAYSWASLVHSNNQQPIDITGEDAPVKFMPVFDNKEKAIKFAGERFDVMEFDAP